MYSVYFLKSENLCYFFFGMVICQVDSHLINGIILNNEMSVERSV